MGGAPSPGSNANESDYTLRTIVVRPKPTPRRVSPRGVGGGGGAVPDLSSSMASYGVASLYSSGPDEHHARATRQDIQAISSTRSHYQQVKAEKLQGFSTDLDSDDQIQTRRQAKKESKETRRREIRKQISESSSGEESSDTFYNDLKDTVIKLNDLTPRGRDKKLAKELGLVSAREASDAYYGKDQESAEFFLEASKTMLNIAMGFNPATSMGQDVWEFLTGTSLTGDKLETVDRAIAFFGIVTGSCTGGLSSSALRSVKNLNRLFKQSEHLVKDAAIVAALLREGRNSVKANLDLYRGWIKNHRILKIVDAAIINSRLAKVGYVNPPFKFGTDVFELIARTKGDYVRVYTGDRMARAWIMKKEAIQGLTPAQIAKKYSLPEIPTHIVDVHVPAGTELYRGRANWLDLISGGKRPDDALDGAVQYLLKEKLDLKYFTNARKIGAKVL